MSSESSNVAWEINQAKSEDSTENINSAQTKSYHIFIKINQAQAEYKLG